MAQLVSVNVGTPQPLAGAKELTGIFKRPRTGPVTIDAAGVLGDAVMDKRHHGGPDQAIYLYLQSDYDWWVEDQETGFAPGTFGENFTIAGVAGEALAIGDRFAAGDVIIEVTSHREPCNTLARRMGDKSWVRRFFRAGRPGAYCRVIAAGTVEAGMNVAYTPFAGERVTVGELMALTAQRNIPPPDLRRVLATPVHYKMRAEFEALLAQT